MKKLINEKGMVAGIVIVGIYVLIHHVIVSNMNAIYVHMALRRIEMVNPSDWTLFVYNAKATGLNFFMNQYVGWSIIALVCAYIITYIATFDTK